MSDTKFTPGPWNVERTDPKNGLQRIVGSQNSVAEVYFGGLQEGRENARLIAAAPDLYAACKAAEELIDPDAWHDNTTDGPGHRLMASLRAALAKANGA